MHTALGQQGKCLKSPMNVFLTSNKKLHHQSRTNAYVREEHNSKTTQKSCNLRKLGWGRAGCQSTHIYILEPSGRIWVTRKWTVQDHMPPYPLKWSKRKLTHFPGDAMYRIASLSQQFICCCFPLTCPFNRNLSCWFGCSNFKTASVVLMMVAATYIVLFFDETLDDWGIKY